MCVCVCVCVCVRVCVRACVYCTLHALCLEVAADALQLQHSHTHARTLSCTV